MDIKVHILGIVDQEVHILGIVDHKIHKWSTMWLGWGRELYFIVIAKLVCKLPICAAPVWVSITHQLALWTSLQSNDGSVYSWNPF